MSMQSYAETAILQLFIVWSLYIQNLKDSISLEFSIIVGGHVQMINYPKVDFHPLSQKVLDVQRIQLNFEGLVWKCMTRFEQRILGESKRKDRLTYAAYRLSDSKFTH